MYSKEDDRKFVIAVFSQDTCREGDKAHQHEKDRIDIGEHIVYVFRIYGNEEMVRPPVGKEQGKAENIREKNRHQSFDREPEAQVVYWSCDHGNFYLENKYCHHDGKDTVGKLVKSRVVHG